MLQDGLSYPLRGESAIGRIIIGGVLLFFGWLVIPFLAYMGYIIRVLGETAAGNEDPPAFEDWGDLIVKGVVGTAITIGYALIPFVVLFAVLTVAGVGAGLGSEGAGAGLGAFGILLYILTFMVVLYALPAGLTSYAHEGSIGAAFNVGRIKTTILSTEYLAAVLLPLVVAFITNIIITVLAVTVVGLLLVPFVLFYMYVAIFYMFGTAYRSTQGIQTAEPSTSGTAI